MCITELPPCRTRITCYINTQYTSVEITLGKARMFLGFVQDQNTLCTGFITIEMDYSTSRKVSVSTPVNNILCSVNI